SSVFLYCDFIILFLFLVFSKPSFNSKLYRANPALHIKCEHFRFIN
ncbi:unnamed protein product, partial [Larinioides sclopetarius]